MKKAGHCQLNSVFFDTLHIVPNGITVEDIRERAEKKMINLRYLLDGSITIALDETVKTGDLEDLLWIFKAESLSEILADNDSLNQNISNTMFKRTSSFLTHPIFSKHHSESRMVRYMKQLENKDISLVHSMIPLGTYIMGCI